MCALCLLIDTEISIHVDNDMQDDGHSGLDDEDFREEENPKGMNLLLRDHTERFTCLNPFISPLINIYVTAVS